MRIFSVLAVFAVLFFGGVGASVAHADESVEQIRAKAESGDAEAQEMLGELYQSGQGVPQDYTQAATWYRKAAEQGLEGAQVSLHWMYDEGQGVPQDKTQAYMWLNLAATHGDETIVKARDEMENTLTPSQLKEGHRLTVEWLVAH